MTRLYPWLLSRRALLGGPLLFTTPAWASMSNLERDVKSYVALGEHRAGTKTERETIAWLDRRLRQLGYKTERQTLPISTLLDPGGQIIAGGMQTPLFPQWLPPLAALGRDLSGPLVDLAAPAGGASIRLLTAPAKLTANWTDALTEHVNEAVAKGASAILLTLDDPSNDLFVCNQHHLENFAIPVMLFAKHALPQLKSQLGRQASVTVKGRFKQTSAFNILGRKRGVGSTLVISTPLTGWFQCGGERGPGIALWLRMADRLAKQSRPVLMLGTGSHEIGHLGMEHALRYGVPSIDQVGSWVHFGASIAATRFDARYAYKSGQYLVGTENSMGTARKYLEATMPFYVPGTAKTLGESGQVIGAGYLNFIGLSGQFPTFHTPLDKGEAIDYLHLEKIAAAAERMLLLPG